MPKYPFWGKANPEADDNAMFANRCVMSDGVRDWYNGSEYVYSVLRNGTVVKDGPRIEGHEETDFEKGTNNHR